MVAALWADGIVNMSKHGFSAGAGREESLPFSTPGSLGKGKCSTKIFGIRRLESRKLARRPGDGHRARRARCQADVKIIEPVGVSEDSMREALHDRRAYPFHSLACAAFGIEAAGRRYLL